MPFALSNGYARPIDGHRRRMGVGIGVIISEIDEWRRIR